MLVSNGGWTRFSNFADVEDGVEEADWDRCFNMNVKSHLWLMHAAKNIWSVRRVLSLQLHPLQVSSQVEVLLYTALDFAFRNSTAKTRLDQAYAVTKAAQIHLVKSLATIVGPKIRCNYVSPAILLTVSNIHKHEI